MTNACICVGQYSECNNSDTSRTFLGVNQIWPFDPLRVRWYCTHCCPCTRTKSFSKMRWLDTMFTWPNIVRPVKRALMPSDLGWHNTFCAQFPARTELFQNKVLNVCALAVVAYFYWICVFGGNFQHKVHCIHKRYSAKRAHIYIGMPPSYTVVYWTSCGSRTQQEQAIRIT